jgi:hypothetical protein
VGEVAGWGFYSKWLKGDREQLGSSNNPLEGLTAWSIEEVVEEIVTQEMEQAYYVQFHGVI